jgi:hypothetical protein
MGITRDFANIIRSNGDIVISGDLDVNGTQTTINTTTFVVEDKNIELGANATSNSQNDGAGISILLPDASPDEFATLTYGSTADAWSFNKKVGIGTTSPNADLHIAGTNDNNLIIQNTTYQASNQDTEAAIRFKVTASADAERAKAGIHFKNDGSEYGRGDLYFTVDSNDDNGNVDINDTKMIITHEGNVGIGTDSPTAVLHAKNTIDTNAASGTGVFRLQGGVSLYSGYIGFDASTMSIGTNNGTRGLSFAAGGSERMRIDSSGNVGINSLGNTTSTLDLTEPSDTAERAIRIENSSARLYVGVEGAAANRFVGSAADNGFIGTTTADGLEFGTNNNVRMVIDTSGNVGIGTSSPRRKLEVYGVAGANVLQSQDSADSTNFLRMYSDVANGSAINVNTGGIIRFAHSDESFANFVERMTIDADGNVGIGTTSPNSRLHVLHPLSEYTTSLAETTTKSTLQLKTHATDSTITTFGGVSGGDAYIQRSNGPGTTPYALLLNPYGGNVGIGTTSFNSDARLEVNDLGSVGKILLTRSGSPRAEFSTNANEGELSLYRSNNAKQVYLSSYYDSYITGGNLGIGTTTPLAKLHVIRTTTDGAQRTIYADGNQLSEISSSGTNYLHNVWIENRNFDINSGVTDSGYRIGLNIEGYHDSNVFEGTLATQKNIWSRVGNNTNGTGTITNLYNMHLETLSGGGLTITNNWGLYQTGSGTKNYFEGSVGIGTDPQSFSKFQVKAATDQHVSVFTNASGLTIGGLTDNGGSGALRIAGAPLHLTGQGGGAGSGPDIAIDSSGNVGIGTSDIQHDAKLDISILEETYTNAHTALRLGSRTSLGVNEAALTFAVTGQALQGTIFSNYGYDNDVAYQEEGGRPSGYISFSNGLPNTGTGRIIFGGSQIGSTTLIEHAQFNPSGNLQFADGKGIDFSALTSPATSGTATGNVLNDYEEGTWIPTLPGGGTLSVSGAYYTKIGRQVTVMAYIFNINATADSSTFQIGSLPFTTSSANSSYSAGSIGYCEAGDMAGLGIINQPNSTYLYFHYIDGTSSSALTNNQMRISHFGTASAGQLIFTFTYITA